MKTNNKKGSTLFQTGLIVALSLSLVAFEWRYETKAPKLTGTKDIEIDQTYTPITKTEDVKPKAEKIKIAKPFIPDAFKEVKNDIKFDDDKKEVDSVVAFVPDFIPVIDDRDKVEEVLPFSAVEKYPRYSDCDDDGVDFNKSCTLKKIYAHLGKEMKYPKDYLKLGIEGRVLIEFTIDKNGEITNIVAHGKVAEEFKKEATRAISSIPKMQPGSQKGKPVNVKFHLPVVFNSK